METFFGSLNPLLRQDGEVVTELAIFHKEGKDHSHEKWEICYVLEGRGIIIENQIKHRVSPGSVVSIPPNTDHWMIPEGEEELKILLVYSPKKNSEIVY